MISLRWFFLVVAVGIHTIHGEDVCEFANLDFKTIAETSDPLQKDLIEGELPTFKYTVTDAELIGMKDCEVIHTECDASSSTFQFHIQCPHIILKSQYNSHGNVNALLIEGDGGMKISIEDYLIMFDGKYEKVVGKDQKSYPVVQNYKYESTPRGKMSFEFDSLFNGDKARSELVHRFFNENTKEVIKLFQSPTVDRFLDLFIDNINAYSKAQ
ncbi:protein takeout-like [Anticarsia gemmatalis]|uniref:protein takeout-like n=1 Tax=Anticarsia gemmatalis TaxID=129554 RepID=UPI003F757F15